MAKKGQAALVQVIPGFDYASVGDGADQLRSSAEKIRSLLRNTLENVIHVGEELLGVKETLPHGQFGPWLKAEFGWTERSAQNFMNVAAVFGPKSEIIADLRLAPTAAYLLAAPSVPEEARQEALDKAESGQTITAAMAKEIVSEAKKKGKKKPRPLPADKLGLRLVKVLERYRERWKPAELSEFARQLREFADALEKHDRGRKKGKE